jgi:hypothetical protein
LIIKKIKEEERGYEKDNLFGGYRSSFGFGGVGELCPGTENIDHEKQRGYSKRNMGRVDDL